MSPERELSSLRLSLRRVAEIANKYGADLTLPRHVMTDSITDERGWNTLCGDLIDWFETRQTNLVVALGNLEADVALARSLLLEDFLQ